VPVRAPRPSLRRVPPTPRTQADRQLVLAGKLREQRTVWRRLAETRGWVGGHRAPHRDVVLRTDDGVALTASWLPGPSAEGPAVLLVHGFAAHRRKPAYAFAADHLAGTVDVLALDLRGHGASEGRCALGAEEWRDVAAGVAALRRRGVRQVVVVGVSLGALATCHALAREVEVEGAVLISGSARHGDLALPGMQTLDALWRSPVRRRLWQLAAGFRMHAIETIDPYPHPAELLEGSTTPLLVVHAPDDAYVGMDHARELVVAAAGPAVLWEEPDGFGHAEDGLTPAFLARLARAVAHLGETGAFPAR
jgi:pimeloyl-ACP methyl ester carboxylesterase